MDLTVLNLAVPHLAEYGPRMVKPDSGIALVVTALSIYSLGLSPIFTLGTDLIVNSAPTERAGAAAALSETSTELGGAMGMAILGRIGMVVYRSRMTETLPGTGSVYPRLTSHGCRLCVDRLRAALCGPLDDTESF